MKNDVQRGYAAFRRGDPFDEYQTAEWMDGWKTHADFVWWTNLAQALGGTVHGFSHRYSGSFNIRGETHSLNGALLDAVVRLVGASVDTLPKGGDAKQAPCASKGSAVAAGETPKPPQEQPS